MPSLTCENFLHCQATAPVNRFCGFHSLSNTVDAVSFLPSAWNSWIEGFWESSFGDFLNNPGDSIPAALAVLALIIGMIALARSITLTPKPNIHVTAYPLADTAVDTVDGGTPKYSLNVGVVNQGAGLALGVVVTARSTSNPRRSLRHELGSIATGETKRHHFTIRYSGREPTGKVVVRWKNGRRRGVRAKY